MAISFGPIVAGAYRGTYNAVALGFTVEGYRYGVEWLAETINQTDLFGQTMIDMVYLGANAQLSYRSRTYSAADIAPATPWGPLGQIASPALPISRLARNAAKPFVLTAVANTPAAAAPATLTAALAILAPNSRVELLFDSKAREIPVTLNLLPYESATADTMVHATST